jgi:hypothetical protein
MKWLPIESAPKNGGWVMVHDAGHEPPVLIAHWHKRFGAWAGTVLTTGRFVYWKNPTHWMPLPEPPTAELENEG